MEIERLLEAGREAGAREAGYVTLRLPLEIADLFKEWLVANVPDKARTSWRWCATCTGARITIPPSARGGKGHRPYAWTLGRRIRDRRPPAGLTGRGLKLTTAHFRRRLRPASNCPCSDVKGAAHVRKTVSQEGSAVLSSACACPSSPLGVADLARAIAFYEALGLRRGHAAMRASPSSMRAAPCSACFRAVTSPPTPASRTGPHRVRRARAGCNVSSEAE